MIKFKIDENLPAEAAAQLVTAGHDAVTVLDQQLGGAQDSNLADVCRAEGRAILTLDLDFSDIRTYPPNEYPGIVVLRLALQDKASVLAVLRSIETALVSEPLAGKLWIVDEEQIRIRD